MSFLRSAFRLIRFFIFSIPLAYSYEGMAQPRKVTSLNEGWEFFMGEQDPAAVMKGDTGWVPIDIPHTWNNSDIQSGEKVQYGTGWYKKELLFQKSPQERQYFLRFDGVGQHAMLYINGSYVGEHLGSYSGFCFNITSFLKWDTTNLIALRANNELNASYPRDNFLFGIYGGIYRDVSLIVTDNIHISLTDHGSPGVYIHQDYISRHNARFRSVTQLKNDGTEMRSVTLSSILIDGEGNVVKEIELKIDLYPGGPVPVTLWMEVRNPRLWNGKEDPHLYTLQTSILQDGHVLDRTSQKTGIRFFSIDPEAGFILNGKPYRLFGVCRHQEWQDLGNALLPEHHRRDMELIDELGATSIRLAHYQQAQYIYDLADSLGILVWAEIPFVNGYLEGADGNAMQQLTELIKQNFNHPSIFVWGLHNEVIKGELIQQPVNLTRDLHNLAKDLDPGRPTVAVSNIWWVYDHPIHGLADLQGFNQYTGWYGGQPEGLGKWIEKYHAAKLDVRFSVSEYGAGGNINHQSEDVTTVPNPTGQFFPEGYQTRYHEITWTAIEKAPFIWASYVWNMFDFSVPEWDRGGIKGRNHKGLISYDRGTKKDAFFWYKANWSEEPVLYLAGRRANVLKSDTVEVKAYCNFGAPELLIDGVSYGKMKAGINRIQFTTEAILTPGEHTLEIEAFKDGNKWRDRIILNR